MSLFGGLRVSSGALTAERARLNVIAENIANAETTRTAEGGPYRRQQVVLMAEQPWSSRRDAEGEAGGVQVAAIVRDATPPRVVYDPSHPDANSEGYVETPNVDVPAEVVDMMAATRAYEANAIAFQSQRRSQERSLELLS